MKRILLSAVIALLVSACATGTKTHTKGSVRDITTEKTVPIPFAQFWDKYVESLSESFFVINNISKESRIINLDFSANSPSDYIDCGDSTVISEHPALGNQTFRYQTADSSSYWIGIAGTNHIADITREASLNGKINVFMAPKGDETLLRVNAKYVWSLTSRSFIRTTGGYQPSNTTSMSFSSKSPETKYLQIEGGKQQAMSCSSKGKLEDRLLNLVSG